MSTFLAPVVTSSGRVTENSPPSIWYTGIHNYLLN